MSRIGWAITRTQEIRRLAGAQSHDECRTGECPCPRADVLVFFTRDVVELGYGGGAAGWL